ncbi:hypothetical protein [Phyllobacterium ifriqiyense]|uniref:hypothetical protein n=1 Tax=Phyllobacterium ifriqiyense TaxID=314238 RepID=UPI003392C1C9
MPKKKTKKPSMYVTPSLGLFYLNIEYATDESEIIGPFRTLAEAEEERSRQTKLRKAK